MLLKASGVIRCRIEVTIVVVIRCGGNAGQYERGWTACGRFARLVVETRPLLVHIVSRSGHHKSRGNPSRVFRWHDSSTGPGFSSPRLVCDAGTRNTTVHPINEHSEHTVAECQHRGAGGLGHRRLRQTRHDRERKKNTVDFVTYKERDWRIEGKKEKLSEASQRLWTWQLLGRIVGSQPRGCVSGDHRDPYIHARGTWWIVYNS